MNKLNLNQITALKHRFNVPVGFSDHSMNPVIAPSAAVALGACVIEKHITLSRKMKGPDHGFALEPGEFHSMVKAIRDMECAMGSDKKVILPEERETALLGRRSIIAADYIPKGTKITQDMLTLKRPGTGIEPRYLSKVSGRIAKRPIEKDTVVRWKDV